jgi:hypothetical protein
MALIEAPYGGGTLRGTIGSTTFQRGRYGNLARQHVLPVNPNSARQVTTRLLTSFLSNRFANDLTASEVAAWNAYAALTNVSPGAGTVFITGQAMYIRNNYGIIANLGTAAAIDSPPTVAGNAFTPILTMTFPAATGILTNTVTAPPMPAVNSTMIYQLSIPQKASKSFFKGPFARAVVIRDTTDADPFILQDYGALTAGMKVFVRYRLWNGNVGANKTSLAETVQIIAT